MVFTKHMLLQPQLAVVPQLFGVVMPTCLDGKIPRHTRLKDLKGLAGTLMPTVVVIGAIEPQTSRGDVWCVCLRGNGGQKQFLTR